MTPSRQHQEVSLHKTLSHLSHRSCSYPMTSSPWRVVCTWATTFMPQRERLLSLRFVIRPGDVAAERLEKGLRGCVGVSLPIHKGHVHMADSGREVHTWRKDLLTDLATHQLCVRSYGLTPTLFNVHPLYWFARVAINKGPRSGSNNRNLFSHNSGGWKSKIKVLAGLISSDISLPGL